MSHLLEIKTDIAKIIYFFKILNVINSI